MTTTFRKIAATAGATAAAGAIIATPVVGAATAGAATPTHNAPTWTFQAKLTELNHSGAWSTVWGTLHGDKLKLKITSHGLLAGSPHAQHIHVGAAGTCPSPNATGTGVNGHLLVSDAMKNYGMPRVSLTTSGDTSSKSALAVDRFPKGDATYERTITLDPQSLQAVKNGTAVVVQHGIDYNKNGKYDGPGKSDLDPSLPEEATDPATCGVLTKAQMNQMPTGGVQTGIGRHDASSGWIGTGGAGVATAGVAGLAGLALTRRRQNRSTDNA